MPFGFLNRTRSFGLTVGYFATNVFLGFTEEIVYNFTSPSPANAFAIPETMDINEQVLATTKKCAYGIGSVLAGSQVKSKVVELVAGATWTLIP